MRCKKSIYLLGFVLFTISSLMCGLAGSIYWLIAFRVLQAVGASMTMALGIAIVTEAFPPKERGMALGITGSIVSIGVVIGPTLGGLIIDSLSWHWIFFVNLPVGVLGAWMAWRFVPVSRPPGGQRFDYWGALAMFAGLLSISLALTSGQQTGFAQPKILTLFAIGIGALVIFIIIELRTRQPMLDLRLFLRPLFSINLITGFATFFAMAGCLILLPFFFQGILGYSTRQVGLFMAVVPILMGLTAPLSGSLSDRFGTRPITAAGLLILMFGYYAISKITAQMAPVEYAVRFAAIGLGMGIFQSPNNSAVMGSVPRERLGITSGMLSVTRTLGQTTGIAMLGALWASQTFHQAGQIYPAGATSAPPDAQVAGMQQTFLVAAAIISLALLLSLWGIWVERRSLAGRTP
jgi:EmrB/QacA subfamily drug resistance transporter